ncbi:hypothetical protein D6D08_10073 [Aureobasidium pullulans]|nr:hypothetical protein D6D08_10073 [Aureobasidium pullulans]
MSDYPSMRNIDLQALLKNRRLPHTGNKATLIKRLYDDDALERLFRPLQNPDEDCYELRKFVHRENLLKITAQLQKGMFSTAKKTSILKDLKDGKCHELSCCLCGIGKLSKATENLFGRGSRCEDGTCANLMKCHKCRRGLEEPNEAYLRREQDSCTDASCGNLSRVHEKKKHNRLETTDRRAGPLSALSSNASYDSVERPRHGIIDAMIGPRMRNEDLRRRRASKILTGYTESYEGPASSGTRKRRFSNLGLEYPLPSRHPLAQCIRDEEKREELERARAQRHHERPSWFGTQEDPLPDFWMGRPILSEKEISILKCLPSIPKYYLSESEDNDILLPEGAKEKRLCTVIRRLEAELMSRDFWMQSLGYNAADAFGKFPSGHYVVAGTDSLS